MASEDKEKTSIATNQGTYCYNVMPFGLKNAGATFQRLVNKVFPDQIGCNIEAYVDNIVIKTNRIGGYKKDLEEVFEVQRRY